MLFFGRSFTLSGMLYILSVDKYLMLIKTNSVYDCYYRQVCCFTIVIVICFFSVKTSFSFRLSYVLAWILSYSNGVWFAREEIVHTRIFECEADVNLADHDISAELLYNEGKVALKC